MVRPSKLVMPGILLGLLSCCMLVGAEPPASSTGPSANTTDAKQAEPLTYDSLLQMLRSMGYEPRIEEGSNGTRFYHISFHRDTWDFSFYVTLSYDKAVIWIGAYLDHIPANGKVLPEPLLKLLQMNNNQTGKAKFVLSADGRLYLQIPLDNRGVTAAQLRDAIDNLAATVKTTNTAWKTGLWTAEGKEAAAFKTKVEALYDKLQAAYQEFNEALNPVFEGGKVDRERLKNAHAKLMQTVREVRDSMKTLEVPSSPAAHELVEVYRRLIEADEAFFGNELAQVVRLIGDDKGNSSDTVAKIKELTSQLVKNEEAAIKALQVAKENFRKEYGTV